MSKLSFEKGQKTAGPFHEDPIKNEVLKIVTKKIIKKHIKGGITAEELATLSQDINDPYFRAALEEYNSGDTGPRYTIQPKKIINKPKKVLKEKVDEKLPFMPKEWYPKKKPKSSRDPTPLDEHFAKLSNEDILEMLTRAEEAEKREQEELKTKEKNLISLKSTIPVKVTKVVYKSAKKDVNDRKESLDEKRNELYGITEMLRRVDDDGNYIFDDPVNRAQLESEAYALRQQIDIIKDLLKADKEKLEEIERKNKFIDDTSLSIDRELKLIQTKLKSKDEVKRTLEEKAETKRKNMEESINQAKLQLKQKSLFPNIQKLRYEKDQQDKIKNKKKKLKK